MQKICYKNNISYVVLYTNYQYVVFLYNNFKMLHNRIASYSCDTGGEKTMFGKKKKSKQNVEASKEQTKSCSGCSTKSVKNCK